MRCRGFWQRLRRNCHRSAHVRLRVRGGKSMTRMDGIAQRFIASSRVETKAGSMVAADRRDWHYLEQTEGLEYVTYLREVFSILHGMESDDDFTPLYMYFRVLL